MLSTKLTSSASMKFHSHRNVTSPAPRVYFDKPSINSRIKSLHFNAVLIIVATESLKENHKSHYLFPNITDTDFVSYSITYTWTKLINLVEKKVENMVSTFASTFLHFLMYFSMPCILFKIIIHFALG